MYIYSHNINWLNESIVKGTAVVKEHEDYNSSIDNN